ncbi:MAG: hypothetical protein E2P02_08035 [Acidobacteria bacterium]|nr:MAG: hypothetical protein E2P02_08035 [Acidobacteriota bacterium]
MKTVGGLRNSNLAFATVCLLALAPGARAQTSDEDGLVSASESKQGSESLRAEAEADSVSWLEPLRYSLDVSFRASKNPDSSEWPNQLAIGLDFHKVVTSTRGDWGTLVLQGYMTRWGDMSVPRTFDDGNQWELVFRSFFFNLTPLGRNKPNLRVGHFEIPYGLDYVIDTQGWLRQTIQARNVGIRADWGLSVNGTLPALEYELSLTRGTGHGLRSEGSPYLVAGRVGTPREARSWLGLSLLQGEVVDPAATARRRGIPVDARTGDLVRRFRVGVDVASSLGPLSFLGEASYGRDFDDAVVNLFAEMNWEISKTGTLVYAQARHFSQEFREDWTKEDVLVLGIRHPLDRHWTLSGSFDYWLHPFGVTGQTSSFRFQMRCRL